MFSLMRISVENGRTMTLTRNVIFLIFFCVTCTSAQADFKLNNWNTGDYGTKFLDNNNLYFPFYKNNLGGSEQVHIQVYYECLCSYCRRFEINEFAPVVAAMSAYLDIQTYPFGNAQILNNNGRLDFQCQHGPPECYGNKLHACALDNLQYTTALLYNICLMNTTNGKGSDDISADRCGYLMNVNSEPIKQCARSTRGSELMLYYGQESKTANFSSVPYVLINGKVYQGNDFKKAVCDAFTNPPPSCV